MDADRPRVVVLASGGGTNLQALIDATHEGRLVAQIVAVVSDRADAGALERARRAGIAAVHLGRTPDEGRHAYDARLADAVAGHTPAVVVLAGWMRLLTMAFLGRFPGRVMNLHPARPGDLPGTRAIERAFEEHRSIGRTHSGVMVHLVPDEGVDDGPVICTEEVPILPGDTFEEFAARIHAAEHRLIVEGLSVLLATLS